MLQKQKRHRNYHVHPINQSRQEHGEYFRLVQELKLYEDHFFRYFRMTKDIFAFLLVGLQDTIVEPTNLFRNDTICLEQRLAITLR